MNPVGPVIARVRVGLTRQETWDLLTQYFEGERLESQLTFDTVGPQQGKIDVWVRGHVVGWKWMREDGKSTAPLITLRPTEGATQVTVTETGFDAFAEGASRAHAAQEEWEHFLDDFVSGHEAPEPAESAESAAAESAAYEPAHEPAGVTADAGRAQDQETDGESYSEPGEEADEQPESAADDVQDSSAEHAQREEATDDSRSLAATQTSVTTDSGTIVVADEVYEGEEVYEEEFIEEADVFEPVGELEATDEPESDGAAESDSDESADEVSDDTRPVAMISKDSSESASADADKPADAESADTESADTDATAEEDSASPQQPGHEQPAEQPDSDAQQAGMSAVVLPEPPADWQAQRDPSITESTAVIPRIYAKPDAAENNAQESTGDAAFDALLAGTADEQDDAHAESDSEGADDNEADASAAEQHDGPRERRRVPWWRRK
jgi:hypothetical protein